MSWQLLILTSVVLASISGLLQRLILREQKSDPLAYAFVFQILNGLLIAALGFLISDMSLPKNIYSLIPNLTLTALFYGFSTIFIFKALKIIESSKFSIIFATRVIFTITASSLILNETLRGQQLLGALFVFAGVLLVSFNRFKFTFGKGEILTLAAAACFGSAVTNDRFIVQSFNVYPYLSLAFLLPAVVILGFDPKLLKRLKPIFSTSILKRLLILIIVYSAAAITFFEALQMTDNSSQLASINITSVVVTVALAIIFLNERSNLLNKILGAIIAFAGLKLLIGV